MFSSAGFVVDSRSTPLYLAAHEPIQSNLTRRIGCLLVGAGISVISTREQKVGVWMRNKRALVASAVSVALLVVTGASAAADIRGTISTTLVLTEDSQLVGDVTCTVVGAPCIAFGASGISLKLNGFTITGLADPVTGCAGTNNTLLESGLDVSNQRGAVIQGPGLVQRFRSDGIRINVSERVLVTLLTSSTNCASGVRVIAGSDNEIVNNTLIRNGNTTIPCGGI